MAIIFGVALGVGVLVARATTVRAGDRLVEGIAGRADVVVTPVGTAGAERALALGRTSGDTVCAKVVPIQRARAQTLEFATRWVGPAVALSAA